MKWIKKSSSSSPQFFINYLCIWIRLVQRRKEKHTTVWQALLCCHWPQMMTHQAPLACLDQLEDRYLFVILDISGFFFLLLRKKTDLFHETILKKNLDFVVLWVPFSCRGYISLFHFCFLSLFCLLDHFLLNFCAKRTGWSKCKAFRLFFFLGEYHLVIVVLRHV